MYRYLNKIGYYLLIVFFMLVPIHFWTKEKIFYVYKEMFAVIFLLLIIPLLRKNSSFHLKSEHVYYLCFIIYVLLSSICIESRLLYLDLNDVDGYDTNGNIYVIRNTLIYIPMLMYIYRRGLTFKEITLLLKVISVFGVISVFVYLSFYEIATDLKSALKLLTLGGYLLSYNTFVPYLTFPFISSMYLAYTETSKIRKLFFILIALFIFSYITISTSRQSIGFCIIAFLAFASFYRNVFKNTAIIVIISVILSSLLLPTFLGDIEVSEKLISKTTSIEGLISDDTNRFETLKEGLLKLSFIEYFIGAGVSSVVKSGPHNDYLRWIQRVGLIGAPLGFMPFIISLIGSFKLMRKKYSVFHVFVFLSIFYTLYISLFGYPRDDAFQSAYVWLGLSLWLIVDKSKVNSKR